MLDKFKNFWVTFWDSIRTAYNSTFKHPVINEAQSVYDLEKINLPDIVINKLNNLALTEATFDIETDSSLTEPIKKLCANLEDNRYKANYSMLSLGDFFAFPSTDSKGNLYHSYLTQDRVRILNINGEEITKACAILDTYTDKNGNDFYLLREHSLENNGTLTISYLVVDSNDKDAEVEQWQDLKGQAYQFVGANHIGFGRYKSPTNDRGLSPVYGVPINFGCSSIEADIFEDLENIREEFRNGKSKIFADPLIMKKGKDKLGNDAYEMPENIFPVSHREGVNSSIDIFNPNLRFSEHYSKLVSDLALYEKQIGTSKGILTDNETIMTATATAVKRANADTLALLKKIQSALDTGNLETLKADCVFLNISNDLWSYKSDYFDPFEDPDDQWKRLCEANDRSAVETSDLTSWIFPNMTPEEIEKKLQRIMESTAIDADNALNKILSGQ